MAQTDWIGETLGGRYEITELLGQGGMSAVYKANDPNLRRVVAVKLIHPHLSSDPEFVRRFEEEAATVAQLRNPNLIQVFDFTNDDDIYYIVFEYVPGESVQDRVKRLRESDRQMDVDEAVELIAQSADGLQYAHKKGLVHRDIKPANIMINVQNTPIVMDFGIAKIMGGTQHTATGAILGTARYMSPEQIKGEQIDPRTDIYSLGVTLFEMLGGRPPFNADSAMTLMMMHITDPVPDLRDLRADIPASLGAVASKAMAKDPDDRFQTAAEFAAALRNPDLVMAAADATMVETGSSSKAPDPDMTVVEPFAATSALAGISTSTADSGAGAVPPTPAAATAAPSSSGSRNWLYIAGGALALLLLLGGIWAVFLRDDGGEGGDPAVAAIASEETAAAAIPVEEPATEEPPEPTQEPTEEPTEEATEAPTAEPEPPAATGAFSTVEGEVTVINDGEETLAVPGSLLTTGTQITTAEDSAAEFTLEDGSIIQLGELSGLDIRELAEDPADDSAENVVALLAGDFLLRQPEQGNVLLLLDGGDNLLGSLEAAAAAAAKPAHGAARHLAQEASDEAAMAINLGLAQIENVTISCFAGQCTVGDSFLIPVGEEVVIDRVERALISQAPITNSSTSYTYWQEACTGCLPEAAGAIAETILATATTAPPAEAPPTDIPPTAALPTATIDAPTATTTAPTATIDAPTATTDAPTATTVAPTAEATATQEAPAALSVTISGIALQDGRYVVSYSTSGYTEQLPGQHVHFYFDTVAEAQAGVPGNGPWILYGGPRPFTGYGEGDRPGGASAMCARVANADHSIIYGSGNCYPLP